MRTPEQSIAIHQCLRILGHKDEVFDWLDLRMQIHGICMLAIALDIYHEDLGAIDFIASGLMRGE